MTKIFNYKDNQPVVWFNRSLERSNQYCLYCGNYIGVNSGVESNKEHLIAREFVPNEYFSSTDFNFLFRCCVSCNNRKSNIERHLSTSTLFNSDARKADESINKLALKKANNDYHPDQRGKLVIDSFTGTEIKICKPGFNLKIGFIGPPQSKEDYVEELSYRHVQGLFSLLTSKCPLSSDGTNLLPFKNFHILGIYPKNDWGNHQIEYLIKKTKNWFSCCNISVANGFFKALMLKSDDTLEGWFWALEWNKSLRILGGLISENRLHDVYSKIPELEWSPWMKDMTGEFRTRRERILDGDDCLFRENSDQIK